MIYACHACDAISLCCFLRCLCSNSNGRSVTKIVSNYLCLRMGEIERETRWPREACFEVCQLRCWTGPLNCPLISSCLFTSPRRLFLAFCGSMLRKNYYLRFSSGAYWRLCSDRNLTERMPKNANNAGRQLCKLSENGLLNGTSLLSRYLRIIFGASCNLPINNRGALS